MVSLSCPVTHRGIAADGKRIVYPPSSRCQRGGWSQLRQKRESQQRSHSNKTASQLHFTIAGCHNWVNGSSLKSGVMCACSGEACFAHVTPWNNKIPQARLHIVLKVQIKNTEDAHHVLLLFSALFFEKMLNVGWTGGKISKSCFLFCFLLYVRLNLCIYLCFCQRQKLLLVPWYIKLEGAWGLAGMFSFSFGC